MPHSNNEFQNKQDFISPLEDEWTTVTYYVFLDGHTLERFSLSKSWLDQILDNDPCQEKIVNFFRAHEQVKALFYWS